MKKSTQATLGLALFGLLGIASFSSCQCADRDGAPTTLRSCECGTEDHDVLGCPAECSTGKTECENPLCTCEHTVEVPAAPGESATNRPAAK